MTSRAFDYIVVGGGSSGAVLANRLSRLFKVCLVEAGPDSKWNPLVQIPLAVGFLVSFNQTSNWCFETIPQRKLNGRSVFWPRGKMLGGSSSMNGMVYQRGHPQDYDDWEAAGNPGWGYKSLLPFFKNSECWEPGINGSENSFHGTKGPMRISAIPSPNPLAEIFVKAGEEVGLPYNSDFNGESQEGVGLNLWTGKRGLRCSTAAGYLSSSVRQRENLDILTSTIATKVLVNGKGRANGIEITPSKGGPSSVLHAEKEIVLCGGTLNSAQLLMLSGIGPSDQLSSVGVSCVRDLPGVGENLQDHLNIAVSCAEDSTTLSYGLSPWSLHRWIMAPFQLIQGKGMLTSTFAEGGGFAKTTPDQPLPDVQFHFYPSKIERKMTLKSILGHGFSLQTCQLRPRSKGNVRLRSANPRESLLIDPAYLTDEDDMVTLVNGVKLARRILSTDAFKPVRGQELKPGSNVVTDEELREFIRNHVTTIFHPTGTCKMGPSSDSMAVVDPSLRVYGVENLRVADCSIMPTVVGGNTNMPAVAIGEKAADLIVNGA